MDNFIPHCVFFDCMEFGKRKKMTHSCEECRFWAYSRDREIEIERNKWKWLENDD